MNQAASFMAADNSAFVDRWKWLAPLALLVVGIAFVPLAHVDYLRGVPGDMGDGRFNGIILEHFYRWLTGQESNLLSPSFFYPMPGALTFSDNHWGTAWIYSGFRLMGFDRYLAFDLWYLTGYMLNFLCAHVVLRRLGFSPIASASGAFVFAFSMAVSMRHGHAQLTYRFLMPIALLMWLRFTESMAPRWLGYCALAVAGQFYASIYLGYFLLLLLAGWAIAQCIFRRELPWHWTARCLAFSRSNPRSSVTAFVLLGLSVLSLCALMYPYIHYSHFYGFQREGKEIFSQLPRLGSYLLADSSSIWGGISARVSPEIPMRHEQQMFMGLGVALLALLGVWKGGRLAREGGIAFLLIALFTLCIGSFSLYMYVSGSPGINAIRAMARVILVLVLPVSIASATAVDHLRKNWGWTGQVMGFLLMAAVFMEALSVNPQFYLIADAKERAAAVRAAFPARIPPDAIVYVPPTANEPFYLAELDGMILAQELGVKTVNGYSGNVPPGYGYVADTPACHQANGRIRVAVSFLEGRRPDLALSMANPLLLVTKETECPRRDVHALTREEMHKIGLTILSVEMEAPGRWKIRLRIDNQSSYSLQTAPAVHPVRISWQFYTNGELPDGKWAPRADIEGGDIGPGESRETKILVDEPSMPGRYALSISMVAEGYSWFHDNGMNPQVAEKVFWVK